MTDFIPPDSLQPSLLDRLTDNDPEKQTESRERRTLSMRKLRQVVLRDLSWLLNTGNLEQVEELEDYPEVRRSTLNYGMHDLAGTVLSGADLSKIETGLRRAILDFEPRVLPKSLRVRVSIEKDEMNHNHLMFDIEGELWGQPLPQRLLLKTEVDLENGAVFVEDASSFG